MCRSKKASLLLIIFSFSFFTLFAQDNLLAELDKDAPKQKDYTFATFKSTRLINGSTIECLGDGVLDFRISHRFGQVNEGLQNFYGLDNAITKLSLDYGITKWLMVGLGHTTYDKENDGYIKIKMLPQQNGGGSPFTLTYFGSISIQTLPAPTLPDSTYKWLFSNRLYFINQLLIARKFSKNFSLQLMPTIVHFNLVDSSKFNNNTFAIGVGLRQKITRSSAITAEYYYRLNNSNMLVHGLPTYNSFSIGYEVETGGHVFQLMLTNAPSVTERSVIAQTTDLWAKNQLHLGFNISRVFTIVKPKGYVEGGDTKKW